MFKQLVYQNQNEKKSRSLVLVICMCWGDTTVLFVVGWSDWTFSFDCRGITYLNAFSVSYEEIGDYLVQVVKIRLQQQRGLSPELLKYKGPVHCARMIIREEGILGLWAGAAPTVMRNGTNQAAMFTAKNAFDVLLWKKHEGDGKVLQPWQSMISGFLAGTAGPVCTGPFDVVKTRLMAQTRDGGALKYKGMIHAIRTIYAEEGLLALWKGLLPRLMRIPPGQAIMWAVADQVTGFYERRYLRGAPL